VSFSVEWSKTAAKQLLKIPKKQRLIILSWVQDYLDEFEHYCLWPCAKWVDSYENPSIRWFLRWLFLPNEGKMAVEDDASRVSIESAGGLVFSFG